MTVEEISKIQAKVNALLERFKITKYHAARRELLVSLRCAIADLTRPRIRAGLTSRSTGIRLTPFGIQFQGFDLEEFRAPLPKMSDEKLCEYGAAPRYRIRQKPISETALASPRGPTGRNHRCEHHGVGLKLSIPGFGCHCDGR
jgi:hypothetical protein